MSTKLQDELGFALKHDGKEWLVIEEGTDDRCATITEQVLWKALIEALATPVAPAGDKPSTSEPVAWQWRRKGEPWSREQTWTYEVFATTDDSEVRALYTAPPDVQRDADQFTQAIQRLNSIPYALTKDECIQAIRELRDSAKAPT